VGEPGEFGVVVVEAGVAVVGESGHQQRAGEVLAVADPDRLVVAPGAEAWCRPVKAVQGGDGQGPEQRSALVGQADRGAEEGIAVRVVGGAVQGVNTPLQIRPLTAAPAALLGQYAQGRGFCAQDRQHGLFGGQIGLGDQITGPPLLPHPLELAEVAPQLLSTGFSGPAGHRRQMLQFAVAQAASAQAGVREAAGVTHSSSRGMPGRTLPRPKWRPNWSS